MPTLREVTALADSLGLTKSSAQPGPVGSLEGLEPLAFAIATAKVGDAFVASREFDEGEYRLRVVGEPTEYEHPWYPGTRVINVRVVKGRTEFVLTAWGDGKQAHLVGVTGLPKRLVGLAKVS